MGKNIFFENKRNYQRIISKTKNEYLKGNYTDSIYYAKFGANYAWFHYPGLFYSEDLENILISVGSFKVDNKDRINRKFPTDNRLKVMHVASEIYDTGGHTRAILNWIGNSKTQYNNLLVLTRNTVIRPFISSFLKRYHITTIGLDNEKNNILDIASNLRAIAKAWPDYIILHTHPDDVIPLLAFSDFEGPPILLFNHADHVFWLGSKISDSILNIRKEGLDLSVERRNTINNFMLPLPLLKKERNEHKLIDKSIMRSKKIILTIASDYKYTPLENYNFSYFFEKFLEKKIDVGLIAIGASRTGNLSRLHKKFPNRILLIPATSNIQQFLSVADIYVDSFPMSSLTSYLEAGIQGIPVLGVKNHIVPFLSAMDPAFESASFPIFLNSLKDLENELEYLIDDPKEEEERGNKIREAIIKTHCGEEWFNLAKRDLKLVVNHKIITQNQAHINRGTNYDEHLAIFLRKAMENNRPAIRLYEWARLFSYTYLNDFIGKNIEYTGAYLSHLKNK